MRVPPHRVVRELGLLAGLLVLLVAGSIAAQQRQVPPAVPFDVVGFVLVVAAVAMLPARWRWPRSVFATVAVIIAVYLLLGYPYGPILLAASVAVFAVVSVDSAAAGVVAVAGAVGLWLATVAVQLAPSGGWALLGGAGAGFAAWLIIPAWLAMVWVRRREAAAAADEARRHELDQQRLGLARDVHDVVAHNLTVIGVQTGAAMRMLDRDPERARQALDTIARTNRYALTELRDTLDLLRSPDRSGDTRPGAPVGGLAELPALVDSARSAGTSVEFHALEPDVAAAPVVERTVYRIVQEALTNALRHAPAAEVTIRLDREADTLLVEVRDNGPGLDGHPEGRGILGMRERAAVVGGTLSVSPQDLEGAEGNRGVVVRARVPVSGDDQ